MFEIRIFRAGKQGVWSIKRLITVWLISLVAGVLVAFFITKNWNFHFLQQIVIIASGAAGGSALPFLILNSQIEKRQKHLKRQLPEFLDLLCVSVQAGLSFDGAVSKINARMKGALIDEFKRVQSDVSLGMTRQYALTQMAKRCDLEEIYLFTSSVIQAEKLGTSMSKTLKMQADNMRDRHRQYVKAEAMKAPVKIIFPMVLFIFPSIFVVLLFPAILTLMKALGN
ncbi:MAG: type II secretion system F family protein [Selenomonadaceae bacterium]|nr:type II secretion system F family protein [Selenomonadaceae bacterium]